MDLTKYKLIDIEFSHDELTPIGFGGFILDLTPGNIDLSDRDFTTIKLIRKDAILNFGAEYVGHRLFFKSHDVREKFILYMTLKWS